MPDLLISSPSNLNNCNIQEARVCEMETQVQSGKRHTIYHLKCTYGGSEYTTDKRYKDFQNLLQELDKCGYTLSVTLFPKRNMIDFFNPSAMAKRLNSVQKFLAEITDKPDISKFYWTDECNANSVKQRTITQKFFGIDEGKCSDEQKGDVSNEAYESNSSIINLGNTQNPHVKPSDFDFLKHVGKGSYGKVYLARHKSEDKIYAVKVLDKSHIKRKNEIKHVMAERNVMVRVIDHPFLVKMHYSFQTIDKLYFVVDFINGGELFYHLQIEQVFSETRARFYSAEIISAIGCLHSHGVIYRDLKPENILLDSEGHIKLTDFGLCKEGMMSSTERTNTFCGTPEYLAPEIIRKKPYTRAVDWWCSGAVLYEMLIGMPPFYNKNYRIMHHDIIHKDLEFRLHVSDIARDLLRRLLEKNPDSRLGAGEKDVNEVKSHTFFHSINWSLLEAKKIKPPLIYKTANKTDLRFIDPEFVKEPVPASVIRQTTIPNPNSTVDDTFLGFTYVDAPHIRQNVK